jgi:hypothetical protein
MVKDRLPNTTVLVNATKPRTGYFEVRVGSNTILSLPSMKRPFPALKALDLEAETDKIVTKLLSLQ